MIQLAFSRFPTNWFEVTFSRHNLVTAVGKTATYRLAESLQRRGFIKNSLDGEDSLDFVRLSDRK